MSATPEQIAAGLDEFAGEQEAKSAQEWLASMAAAYLNEAKQLRAAAALIRAQAERVRVLEAALEAIRDTHIPDQPMADDIDEAEYARKHHLALRLVAKAALISARALRGAP